VLNPPWAPCATAISGDTVEKRLGFAHALDLVVEAARIPGVESDAPDVKTHKRASKNRGAHVDENQRGVREITMVGRLMAARERGQ